MNYPSNIQNPFNAYKKQAVKALKQGDHNRSLENIANAAVTAYEKMPGMYRDDVLEQLAIDTGMAIREQVGGIDDIHSGEGAGCDVLILASTISIVGGHSEMIRQWVKYLKKLDQSTAFFCTNLVESLFTQTEMAELMGDEKCVQYADAASLLERAGELNRFIHKVRPRAIVMVINPHDAIAASVCSLYKGVIPLIFVNHADHLFWLGSAVADTVVEFRRYGAYYTQKHRHVASTPIIHLTSKLNFDEAQKDESRGKIRTENKIPEEATLSLAIATTYKILGSAWSFMDSIVALLRAHPQHHHLLIASSGRKEFERYLAGSDIAERFHILDAQSDLVPYYQGADFMIETFPYKGGMVRYDAFKAGLPTVLIDHPQMPEHTEIQGIPEGYPLVSDLDTLLTEAGKLIQSADYRQTRSDQLSAFHMAHFSEAKIIRQIKELLSIVTQGSFPIELLGDYQPPKNQQDYYQQLEILATADVAFYAGKNGDGLHSIQALLDQAIDSQDLAAIHHKLKYSHVRLPYPLRPIYTEALKVKESGDLESAGALFSSLISRIPEFAPAYLHLAECKLQSGDGPGAIAQLQQFVGNAFDKQMKAEALCTLGKYYRKMKNDLLAAAAFQEAQQLLPQHTQIDLWLAEVYLKLDQNDKGIQLLERIIDTPHASEALVVRARQLIATLNDEKPAEPAATRIRVSVVIPVFNKVELTRNCIETMFTLPPEKTPFEVIIVDNGSTDGTAEYLADIAKRHKQVKVITNPKNLGFSRACNIGANAATGEYLHLLNNDTEPKRGWVDQLVRVLDRDTEVVAVGSKLLFPNGNLQHGGVVAVESRRAGDPLILFHNYYNTPGNHARVNEMMEYTALTAASMMLRKAAFDLVEGFDEGYWNGYEDVDLCFKLLQRGWKLVYQPASVLVHYESQSGPERFTKVKENIQRLHQRWLGVIIPDYIYYGEGHKIKTSSDRIRPYQLPAKQNGARVNVPKDTLTSIVILTYNQLDKTRECLDSLEKYTTLPYEVIVVDNGSKDGTRNFLKTWKKKDRRHTLIQNQQNKGFAGGNNQGIRKAKGDYLVLLNNDTVVTGGWLEGLLRPFQVDETIGLVGPKSNFVAGAQFEPHNDYQNENELQSYAGVYRKLFSNRVKEHHRLVGFCLAIKKAVIVDVGFLDERFGKGNYEDDDFSLRATMAGYKLVIAEDTFIHHYGNSSFKANKIDYLTSLEKNRQIFLDKWEHLEANEPILMDILLEETRLRQELNQDEQLEQVLNKILKLDPRNKRAAEAFFKLLTETERHEVALKSLEAYAKANPGDHEAQNALGMQFWERGDIQQAIGHFQLAMESAPNQIDYLKNFADANIAIERFEAGVQMLTHIIEEFPTDPEAYIKLANLYVEDGNLNAAQQWLIQGKQYNQESPELQNALVAIQQLASTEVNSASNITN